MYHDHPFVERKRTTSRITSRQVRKLTRAIYFTGIMFIISILDLMMNLAQFQSVCPIPV